MKTIKYLSLLLLGLAMAACQGDWDEPSYDGGTPYGDNSIVEHNVITLADLKAKYANKIESNGYMYEEITDDVQLKVVVTGNDLGGNFYKQVCVQDETGGIIIAINQGGLSGSLALGQELLINLKGLYYGAYGSQPQIGMLYNNSGRLQIGQINKYVWEKHYRLLQRKDPLQPVDFASIYSNVKNNCGQLATIKDLTLRQSSENLLFAPAYSDDIAAFYTWIGSNKNYVHHTVNINGTSTKVIIRTSTYARFAAMPLPKRCNLTGIFTRYKDSSGDNWQLLIRSSDDIEVLEQ
ncbi:MAG: hypothetical protein IJ144_07585 [Prevotella sp.]|nr:hypothetical protein [Prevotella sp.]